MNALDAKRIKRLKLSRYAIVTNGKDDWLVDRISGKIMVAAWGTAFRQIAATIPTLRIRRETDKRMFKTILKAIKLTKDQRDWLKL